VTTPISPRLIRGGFAQVHPANGRVLRVIPFQYNADSVTRTLTPRGAGAEGGDRLEALRLAGPPQETIRCDVELDATDFLEFPDQNSGVAENGLHAALALIELLVSPRSQDLVAENALARAGTIEVAPAEAPLTVLVLGRNRVLPVRITELSIAEEGFDTALNPIRARLSLSMRVLTVDDVGYEHRGGLLSLARLRQAERFAASVPGATLGALGLNSLEGGA
jgi:hypothetical protein